MHSQHGRHFDSSGGTSRAHRVIPGVSSTNVVDDQRCNTVSGNSQLVPVSIDQLFPIAAHGLEIPQDRRRRHARRQATCKYHGLTFAGINVDRRLDHLQQLLSIIQRFELLSSHASTNMQRKMAFTTPFRRLSTAVFDLLGNWRA